MKNTEFGLAEREILGTVYFCLWTALEINCFMYVLNSLSLSLPTINN